MKKFLKLITLPLLATILVACGNEAEVPNTESSAVEETSSVEETTESVSESTESETSESESVEETESVEESEDADETAITLSLIVSGTEETLGEFSVPFEDGMNVLGAMEAAEGLEFTFNEEDGVIDVIDGITNDYETGETWVYLLNDQMAEMGVVSQTLVEGDDIKWYFGTIDQIPITIIPADDEVVEEDVTVEDEAAEEQVEVIEDTE